MIVEDFIITVINDALITAVHYRIDLISIIVMVQLVLIGDFIQQVHSTCEKQHSFVSRFIKIICRVDYDRTDYS